MNSFYKQGYLNNSCACSPAIYTDNELMIRYITSDCDAVSLIHDSYGYAKTPEDAVVDVLKAGMNGPFSLFPFLDL